MIPPGYKNLNDLHFEGIRFTKKYKAILEKGRQNNRKRAEKMRELRMSDPEYRAKMEEKERLALEREKKRQERATKKKKIALAE